MGRSKKFGICRFCGARVKIENMAAHERKVHPRLDSEEKEETSHDEVKREIELSGEEIKALCHEARKLLQRGMITVAIKKFEQVLRYDQDNHGGWRRGWSFYRRARRKAYSLNPAYAWKILAGMIAGVDIQHASGMQAKRKKKCSGS